MVVESALGHSAGNPSHRAAVSDVSDPSIVAPVFR